MKKRIGLLLGITAGLVFITTGLLFSEEAVVEGGVAAPAQNEPQVQWIWGEVVSLDVQNKTITVKYLEYETDQEKEIGITADDKTIYENIGSLEEIKLNEAVSIDYTVAADGKNIARNISLEKPEIQQSPEKEIKPEEGVVPPEASAVEQPPVTETGN